MDDKSSKEEWLKSKDAQKKLKVSSCDLMHLREAGRLKFKKVGNAYYYNVIDIKNNGGI
jgi:hypothetical protein